MLAVLVAGRTLKARGSNMFGTDCKLPIRPLGIPTSDSVWKEMNEQ